MITKSKHLFFFFLSFFVLSSSGFSQTEASNPFHGWLIGETDNFEEVRAQFEAIQVHVDWSCFLRESPSSLDSFEAVVAEYVRVIDLYYKVGKVKDGDDLLIELAEKLRDLYPNLEDIEKLSRERLNFLVRHYLSAAWLYFRRGNLEAWTGKDGSYYFMLSEEFIQKAMQLDPGSALVSRFALWFGLTTRNRELIGRAASNMQVLADDQRENDAIAVFPYQKPEPGEYEIIYESLDNVLFLHGADGAFQARSALGAPNRVQLRMSISDALGAEPSDKVMETLERYRRRVGMSRLSPEGDKVLTGPALLEVANLATEFHDLHALTQDHVLARKLGERLAVAKPALIYLLALPASALADLAAMNIVAGNDSLALTLLEPSLWLSELVRRPKEDFRGEQGAYFDVLEDRMIRPLGEVAASHDRSLTKESSEKDISPIWARMRTVIEEIIKPFFIRTGLPQDPRWSFLAGVTASKCNDWTGAGRHFSVCLAAEPSIEGATMVMWSNFLHDREALASWQEPSDQALNLWDSDEYRPEEQAASKFLRCYFVAYGQKNALEETRQDAILDYILGGSMSLKFWGASRVLDVRASTGAFDEFIEEMNTRAAMSPSDLMHVTRVSSLRFSSTVSETGSEEK